jgi:general secretion pathway protein K
MVAVALVTALAVDLAYQTRVALQIAGNARDELRARALARGGVALGRLVLHFQSQLDDAAGSFGGQAGLGGMPRPQLWKLVPVDSSLAASLFGAGEPGGADARGAPMSAGDVAGRLDPSLRSAAPGAGAGAAALPAGTFQTELEDEDRKVYAPLDGSGTAFVLGAQLDRFLAMVADRRWDFLFDREDAGGQRTSRTDLAVNLKDWVDEDSVQSSVTGLYTRPFENGFGDENFAYDRGPDRYKAKNARFDSLEELHLVTGVSDAFMAAFGDRLTVYPSRDAKMNVNADSREELLLNARAMADPPLQAALSDPSFPERLEKAVRQLRLGGFIAMTPSQFAQLVRDLGVTVRSVYLQAGQDAKGAFTDRSRVFRVRGTGRVGDVVKSIDTVVTFDPDQARGGQLGLLGLLLHWQEE